jgi:hypothetical protein
MKDISRKSCGFGTGARSTRPYLLPIRNVGAFRTYSFRRELPEDWFGSTFYKRHYASLGTFDAAFVAFPLNEDCESHFG